MSPPWLPFDSILTEPPLPTRFGCGSGGQCPLARLESGCLSGSRDVCPAVGMFVWEQLILVTKRCGCKAGLATCAHEWYPARMLRL